MAQIDSALGKARAGSLKESRVRFVMVVQGSCEHVLDFKRTVGFSERPRLLGRIVWQRPFHFVAVRSCSLKSLRLVPMCHQQIVKYWASKAVPS